MDKATDRPVYRILDFKPGYVIKAADWVNSLQADGYIFEAITGDATNGFVIVMFLPHLVRCKERTEQKVAVGYEPSG